MEIVSSSEDRISSLPDAIICHILSFLPTKHAAATNILSKTWNSLWLSVFTLEFDAKTFKDYPTFRHVVDSIMLSRPITLPLQSFRLKACIKYNSKDIDRFIDAASQRGIETLDLDMSFMRTDYKLTSSIFSCETLTVLKLKNLFMGELPHQINIPLLKTLHLDNVCFRCHTHMIKFLSGFLILEELQTNCSFGCLLELAREDSRRFKCLPNLVRASIDHALPVLFPLFSGAQILSVQVGRCPYFRVPTLHNLTQLELSLFKCKGKNWIWNWKWKWMLEVLHESPKLQHLTIHEDMNNWEVEWLDPELVPECLSSQLKTFMFTNCQGGKGDLQFVEYVMQNSKVLRSMTIHSDCSIDLDTKYQMLQKLCVSPRGCKLIFD